MNSENFEHQTFTYLFTTHDIEGNFASSVSAFYGPWDSVEAFEDFYSRLCKEDDFRDCYVPDGLTIASKKTLSSVELVEYWWYNGAWQQKNTGSGGGGSSTTLVTSGYTLSISNPIISLPVNNEMSSTAEALNAVSRCEISIAYANQEVDLENILGIIEDLQIKGDASQFKIVNKQVQNKVVTFDLEFNENVSTEEVGGITYYKNIHAESIIIALTTTTNYSALIGLKVEPSIDAGYNIISSANNFYINDNNIVPTVVVDIDQVDVIGTTVHVPSQFNSDNIKIYYQDVYGARYPIHASVASGGSTTVTINGETRISANDNNYTLTEFVNMQVPVPGGTTGQTHDTFQSGETIQIELLGAENEENKRKVLDSRSLTVVRASSFKGIVIVDYGFSLNSDNLVISTYYAEGSSDETKSVLRSKTTTWAYFEKNGQTKYAYFDEEPQLMGMDDSTIEYGYGVDFNNIEDWTTDWQDAISDNNKVWAYRFSKIQDGAVNVKVKVTDNGGVDRVASLTQGVTVVETGEDALMYHLSTTQFVGYRKNGNTYTYTKDIFYKVIKIVGSISTELSVPEEGLVLICQAYCVGGNVVTLIDSTASSWPASIDLNSQAYELTNQQVYKVTLQLIQNYGQPNEITWRSEDIDVYEMPKDGSPGTSPYFIQTDNDAVIIEDDAPNSAILNLSETTVSAFIGNNAIPDGTTIRVTPSADLLTQLQGDLQLQKYGTAGWSVINVENGYADLSTTSGKIRVRLKGIDTRTESLTQFNGTLEFAIRQSGSNIVSTTQSIRVININSGESYRLNITPNIIALDESNKVKGGRGKQLQITVSKVKQGVTDCTGDIIIDTDAEKEPGDLTVWYSRDGSSLTLLQDRSTTGDYLIFTTDSTISNPDKPYNFFLKYYTEDESGVGQDIVVDQESVGFTTDGQTGPMPYFVESDNDVVIIEDSSADEDIEYLTTTHLTTYLGSTAQDSVYYTVTITNPDDCPLEVYQNPVESSTYNLVRNPNKDLVVGSYIVNITAYNSAGGERLGSRTQTIKVIDINEGISYKLSCVPNTFSVENSWVGSRNTEVSVEAVTQNGLKDITLEKTTSNPYEGALVIYANGTLLTPDTTTFSYSASQNTTFILKYYDAETTSWVTVDSETVSFVKDGAQGPAASVISLDNDFILIDDNVVNVSALQQTTVTNLALYIGSSKFTNAVEWKVKIPSDLYNIDGTGYGIKANEYSHTEESDGYQIFDIGNQTSYTLTINSPQGITPQTVTLPERQWDILVEGTYTPQGSGITYYGQVTQTFKVLNISDGVSYKLVVDPNIKYVTSDYSGWADGEEGKLEFSILALPGGDTTGITAKVRYEDLSGDWSGWSTQPFTSGSELTAGKKRAQIQIVKTINNQSVTLDLETIAYVPMASSPYTLQLNNDQVFIDIDTLSSGMRALTECTAELYLGNQLVEPTDWALLPIDVTDTPFNGNSLDQHSGYLTLKTGSTLQDKQTYNVIYKAKLNGSTSVIASRIQKIKTYDIPGNASYKLVAEPNTLSFTDEEATTHEQKTVTVKALKVTSDEGIETIPLNTNGVYLVDKNGIILKTDQGDPTATTHSETHAHGNWKSYNTFKLIYQENPLKVNLKIDSQWVEVTTINADQSPTTGGYYLEYYNFNWYPFYYSGYNKKYVAGQYTVDTNKGYIGYGNTTTAFSSDYRSATVNPFATNNTALQNNNMVVIDSETIGIVKDGAQGPQGNQGPAGAVIRFLGEWYSLFPGPNHGPMRHFNNGSLEEGDGFKYIDVVLVNTPDQQGGSKQIYYAYRGLVTTDYYSHMFPYEHVNEWTTAPMTDFVATQVMLADSAKIDFLTNNELYLYDGTEITGGLRAGNPTVTNDVIMWAGASEGTAIVNAPFKVTEQGKLYATAGEIGGILINDQSLGAVGEDSEGIALNKTFIRFLDIDSGNITWAGIGTNVMPSTSAGATSCVGRFENHNAGNFTNIGIYIDVSGGIQRNFGILSRSPIVSNTVFQSDFYDITPTGNALIIPGDQSNGNISRWVCHFNRDYSSNPAVGLPKYDAIHNLLGLQWSDKFMFEITIICDADSDIGGKVWGRNSIQDMSSTDYPLMLDNNGEAITGNYLSMEKGDIFVFDLVYLPGSTEGNPKSYYAYKKIRAHNE